MKARVIDKDEKARAGIVARKRRTVLRVVFLPSRKYLISKGFTYLEKSAVLYPVAYVHRLCGIAKNMLSGKRKYKTVMGFAESDNEIIRKRIEMMKKLIIVE